MRKILLLLLAVCLFCGVSAQTAVSLKEDAVNQKVKIPTIDSAKEKVEIATDSTLPAHFTLLPDGHIQLTNANGADYENPKLRQFKFKVSVKSLTSGSEIRKEDVVINILDVNDEPPSIVGPFPPSPPYPKGLPQNLTGLLYKGAKTRDGATVYCVKATDPDTNAKLSYSFSPIDKTERDAIIKLFKIVGVGCVLRNGNADMPGAPPMYRIPVRVTDTNSVYPEKASADAFVDVNLDFQPPQIAANPYFIYFDEGSPLGAVIGQIYATQMQSRYNRMEWSLSEKDGNALGWPFSLNKDTGVVTLTSTTHTAIYNRICRQEWHAVVTVKEFGATQKSSKALLILRLVDKNDQQPFLENPIYFASISETTPTTTLVTTINVVDPDSTSDKDLSYTLEGADSKYFRVTKSKKAPFFGAEIYVTGNPKLDYEDSSRADHLYRFQLVVTDGVHPKVRSDVYVEVKNANDENPAYALSTTTLTVNRDSINQVIYQVQASDKDGSTILYAFKGTGSSTTNSLNGFTIDKNTGIVRYITKEETADQRTLTITAEDDGDCSPACPPIAGAPKKKLPSKQDFTLIVKFQDANKHTPTFNECPEFLDVTEEKDVGTFVKKMVATDLDKGKNGLVRYSLKPNSYVSNPSKYFTINATDGSLYTSMKFDREDYDANFWSVWITVEASDSAISDNPQARLATSCTMHVRVLDINDKKPIFLESPMVAVMEAKAYPANAIITTIFAHDDDAFNTSNSFIDYEIMPGAKSFLGVNQKSGIVFFKTATTLTMTDRLITFKIVASDGGSPKLSSTVDVEILVTNNQNELPPTVTYDTAEKKMKENTTDLTLLFRITVTHSQTLNVYDVPGTTATTNKGLASFSKKGTSKTTFDVLKNGPFNAARLDHVYYSAKVELNTKITYNSRAYSVYKLVNVLVLIEDVNNKVPNFITFSSKNAFIPVPENAKFTTNPISTLFAADQDLLVPFRTVTMTLKPTKDYQIFKFVNSQLFINESSVSGGSFDYEKKKLYYIDVAAKDQAPSSAGGQSNEQQIALTVQVTDVNDLPPTFDKTTYFTNVLENAAINFVFFTLKADDEDSVSKNSLTYNILDTGIPFGINATSGEIYVAKRLNFEEQSSYLISCTVFDGKYNAQTKVNITVRNVNDEAPKFDKLAYNLPAFDAGKIPTPWATFTVTDPDNPTAATLSNIEVSAFGRWTVGTTDYFGIEFVSGKQWRFVVKSTKMQPWKTSETLDRHYRFMLKAEKAIGSRKIVTYAQVVVNVNKPPSSDALCFEPGSLIGWPKVGETNALTLGAVNPDKPSGSNSLTFSVADTNYAVQASPNKNKVNYKTGTSATGPGTIKHFNVTVKEAAPSTKSLTSRAFVMVQPKSTNRPSCNNQEVTIYDNTKPMEIFFALRIRDVDLADREKLTFTVNKPATNAKMGYKLLKEIDSVGFFLKQKVTVGETLTDVELTVKDTENQSNTCIIKFKVEYGLSGTLKMTVTPPVVTLPENDATIPKKLASIVVSDVKRARPMDIAMTLNGVTENPGLELLKVNPTTADLYVTKKLDREALTNDTNDAILGVTFTGKATNGASPPVTKSFTLTVTDKNEAPTVSPMTATLVTPSTSLNVVPNFKVTDRDNKANQGAYTVAVTGSANTLFEAKKTPDGFTLAAKANADLSTQSSPIFVPVQITEGSNPPRTVTIKIDLTDDKLTDTNREVNAIVSSGWIWYWMPTVTPVSLGSVYGKVLSPKVMSSLSYDLEENKYPSYFSLNKATGQLSIIGAVPAGNYTVKALAKSGSTTAKASVLIHVRIASNQAVQHAATMRINGIDARHLVLRQKKASTSGTSTTDFQDSITTKISDIIAKRLETSRDKVLILSINEFRDTNGAPYVEVVYAVSGSPYYSPSKLQYYTTLARPDIQAILPAGTTIVAPINPCSTSGFACKYGCVNRIRVNQDDKDVTIHTTASFVGLKVSIVAVCGCEFKPDYHPPDCSINACLNDGKCSLAPGTANARCTCPRGLGLTGPRCQKLDVNFKTRKGFVMTESLGSCSDLHVSFEFISTATPSNEILLYDGPFMDGVTDDYFLVGLDNKKPYLETSGTKGSSPKRVTINTDVAANTWYRLDMFYKSNGMTTDYMEIMIDRCRSVSNTAADGATESKDLPDRTKCTKYEALPSSVLSLDRRIDLSAFPLQVGGSNLKAYDGRGLIGSIRHVRVNSKLRNLLVAKQGLSVNADDNTALNATCYASATKSKCGENATCRPHPSGTPTCKCLPGYRKDVTSGECSVATKIMDFKKQSLTFWKLKTGLPTNRRDTWASIRFRTRQTFGTLLYFTSADGYRNQSVEVRIKNSRVQVVLNLGDYSFKEVILPNTNVSDGEWHEVMFERVLNEVEVILDAGEYGNYLLFRNLRTDKYNYLTLSDEFLGGLRWKRTYINPRKIEHIFSDIHDTCLTDVRWRDEWVPMMSADQKDDKAIANVQQEQNRADGCPNPQHCLNAPACLAPFTCVPQIWRPLTIPACACSVGSVTAYAAGKPMCVALGVCYPNPCRAGTCVLDSSVTRGYKCNCLKGYAGDNCEIGLVATASVGTALIVIIVLLILLIIVAILIYFFYVKRRRRDDKLLADPDDYTRENITPYDEEGAGEEDHDHYDLTYLRKPVTEIQPVKSMPLGAAPHRPSDLGNFLDGRLVDAENDPHGPPQDYSLDYGYEGQGSVVDDLSSLGSGTSDGSQQYDHLHNLGPKFRPLHDLYNHQRNV